MKKSSRMIIYCIKKYPNHWAVLVDEGYQGADEFLRYITSHEKSIRCLFSRECIEFNKNHSSDKIIVENYFGKMNSLDLFFLRSTRGLIACPILSSLLK